MKSTLGRLAPAMGVVLCLGGFVACGDDTTSRGMPTGGSGGTSGSGGTDGGAGSGGNGGTSGNGGTGGNGGGVMNDTTGPEINLMHPMPGEIVGRSLTITAVITDPSGVNPSTVKATVSHNGTAFTIALNSVGNNTYQNVFDMTRLPNSTRIQFPAVEVVADDSKGNHSRTGGIEFTLDLVPPVAELDPGNLWVIDCDQTAAACECSMPFDPVGSDAANDLQHVQQVFFLRAEIQDKGNLGVGSPFTFITLVANANLAILGDISKPLVVDTDGDGICDHLNPDIVPNPNMPPDPMHAVLLSMVQITASGDPQGAPQPYSLPVDSNNQPLCTMEVGGGTTSTPLCQGSGSDMRYVLHDSSQMPATPLIWTLPPVSMPPMDACTGFPFDALANNIPNGWICAAVEAVDGVGNVSVSKPIRLCVDKNNSGACANPGAAPNCTGTVMNGTVNNTPCTATKFPAQQVVRDDTTAL